MKQLVSQVQTIFVNIFLQNIHLFLKSHKIDSRHVTTYLSVFLSIVVNVVIAIHFLFSKGKTIACCLHYAHNHSNEQIDCLEDKLARHMLPGIPRQRDITDILCILVSYAFLPWVCSMCLPTYSVLQAVEKLYLFSFQCTCNTE